MSGSFAEAHDDLEDEGELPISVKQVQRITERIGADVVRRRDAEAAQFDALPLPEQRQSPWGAAPDLAVVQADGGRIQIFDRLAEEKTENSPDVPAEGAASDSTASDNAADRANSSPAGSRDTFWRESKVGVLLTMDSEEHAADPCPSLPEAFIDPRYVNQLVREIGHTLAASDESAAAKEPKGKPRRRRRKKKSAPRPGLPKILVRSLVATREGVERFALLLAAAAWKRGFHAARRKAFLGDGSNAIWSIWHRRFSHYEPIVDFVHAVAYAYAAAMAGRSDDEGWQVYCRWAQLVWSGQVAAVIVELQRRQQELGLPCKEAASHDPRRIVAEGLTYLQNQQSRMRYDDYRRRGLPVTTCHIESAVKQIGKRVKGTEKFWSPAGADAMLQLRADYLSDTRPMIAYWQTRQNEATGHRHYASAA